MDVGSKTYYNFRKAINYEGDIGGLYINVISRT